MMHLGILAYGTQQALSAHNHIIVSSAYVLLHGGVHQLSGIVRVLNTSVGRVPFDVAPHLLQRSGKGGFPFIPGPNWSGWQAVGAALQRERKDRRAERHRVAQRNRQRGSYTELNRAAVLIDKSTPLAVRQEFGQIGRRAGTVNTA